MAPVSSDSRRTMKATLCFAASAIIGWPFSVLLAVPYVLEELCVRGQQVGAERGGNLVARRFGRLLKAALGSLPIALAILVIDSYFYGYLTFPPLNLLLYNLAGPGPELYGVEPASFYVQNLLLNFNVVAIFAFLSLPALAISRFVDQRRFGDWGRKRTPGTTRYPTLLAFRLAPAYVWFGVLTWQAHKEERFGFVAYPALAFSAATTVYLVRGWLEKVYVHFTHSPYRASRSSLFSTWTKSVLVTSALVSLMRILALFFYYHAPMDVAFHLQYHELPRLAISTWPDLYPTLAPHIERDNLTMAIAYHEEHVELDPLDSLTEKLRLCYGKEWYRFPTHFLIPEQVDVEFVKSEFDGILPKKWESREVRRASPLSGWWTKGVIEETRKVREGFNDLNKEEPDRYVSYTLKKTWGNLSLGTNMRFSPFRSLSQHAPTS
jgi:alpha-1,2-mannosyltransferase